MLGLLLGTFVIDDGNERQRRRKKGKTTSRVNREKDRSKSRGKPVQRSKNTESKKTTREKGRRKVGDKRRKVGDKRRSNNSPTIREKNTWIYSTLKALIVWFLNTEMRYKLMVISILIGLVLLPVFLCQFNCMHGIKDDDDD